MKPSNLIITLVIVFFISTTMVGLINQFGNSYSVPIEDGFFEELNESAKLQNEIVAPMANKLQNESSINLITVGKSITSTMKLIFNIPQFYMNFATEIGGYLGVPAYVIVLIHSIIMISIIFSFIYFVIGRKL